MKKNYHPDYEVLAGLYDEKAHGHRILNKRPFPKKVLVEESEYQESHSNWIWLILMLILISIAIWYFFFKNTSNKMPIVFSPEERIKIEKPIDESTSDVAKEIALIKKVLNDLVLSVDTLSKQSQVVLEKEIEIKKYESVFPIKIVTPFAHLRQLPKKEAVSLSTVQKDTVLVAIGESGDWILTYAPSGKEAWVHSSVTSNLEKE